MQNSIPVVYPVWDLKPPRPLPHSYLYHLEPIGIGTRHIESLTSYTERLAAAHTVTVRDLVREEVFPRFERSYLWRHKHASRQNTFWSEKTRALNSTGDWAMDWVGILEELTDWSDLEALAMISWSEVLSVRGLMRNHRVWCPVCYDAWREQPHGVYTPLLWHLEVVDVCLQHNQRLQSRCPYKDCGRTQPILLPKVRPGYCSHCGRWLGASEVVEADTEDFDETEIDQLRWIVDAVGELLVLASQLSQPLPRSRISHFIAYALNELTDGNISALSRVLNLSWRTTRDLAEGDQTPQLRTLLMICRRLGISPADALTEDHPNLELDQNAPEEGPLVRSRHQKAPQPLDKEKVRRVLDAELANEDVPFRCMRDVAESLDYDPSFLAQHFPDRCRAISGRYLERVSAMKEQRIHRIYDEIRQATYQVHERGEYPSEARINQILTNSWYLIDPGAREVWHQTLDELGWEMKEG
jgi:hypothetical protein